MANWIFVDVARAAQALAPRAVSSFLKWKEFFNYSIFNRKYSIFIGSLKYPNPICFCPTLHKSIN
jgi:hypothetical protein